MAIRVVVWGPGEVGSAVARAVHSRDDMALVGMKVFSPHKHGRDAGELIGLDPIGVPATTSKTDILALDADCVIVTPRPQSIPEGLDDDVIAILESGKNVVSTASYHNVAMPNWLNQAQSPTARLRELSQARGAARNDAEKWTLRAARLLTAVKPMDPITDAVIGNRVDKRFPPRATTQRLMAACRAGNVTLHGTGAHPTFMVERLALRMARLMPGVRHVRFIEALDFSSSPDGMWGGLNALGFGQLTKNIDETFFLAKAGDFYYGDLTGNVGHALFGAGTSDIRVQRSLRAIPAKQDFTVGSTRIAKGTAAALHMTSLPTPAVLCLHQPRWVVKWLATYSILTFC
ncbi:hypothetical protein FOS14_03495 [Skermania sp. ID1734]|uniref:hypothetical protein n=1 Tax=Skermania sp. ID1734 TaxID=2597516 RepID=UPI00117F1123|nr:hypothetical protein [Skermania sp. ID1734]TSE01608.1 hypothetical protein FOS14_03495 [Skermania sp. ID1734]